MLIWHHGNAMKVDSMKVLWLGWQVREYVGWPARALSQVKYVNNSTGKWIQLLICDKSDSGWDDRWWYMYVNKAMLHHTDETCEQYIRNMNKITATWIHIKMKYENKLTYILAWETSE